MDEQPQKEHNDKNKLLIHSIMEKIMSKFFPLCTLVISIISIFISCSTDISNQESKPLSYYLKPTVISFENNIANVEIEAIVTNGAIGDVRVMDYNNGDILDIANNLGGTISKKSNKSERTFLFELRIKKENHENEFIATSYMLIHGKDGSKELGMILYHVDLNLEKISPQYYSFEDLVLAERDPNQIIYANALDNYRELYEFLKENEQL